MSELLMLPSPLARPVINKAGGDPFRSQYGPYWGEKQFLRFEAQYEDRLPMLIGDMIAYVPMKDGTTVITRAAVRLDPNEPWPSLGDLWKRGVRQLRRLHRALWQPREHETVRTVVNAALLIAALILLAQILRWSAGHGG